LLVYILDQNAIFYPDGGAAGGALEHGEYTGTTAHLLAAVRRQRGLQRYRAEQGGAVGVVVVFDHSADTVICEERNG